MSELTERALQGDRAALSTLALKINQQFNHISVDDPQAIQVMMADSAEVLQGKISAALASALNNGEVSEETVDHLDQEVLEAFSAFGVVQEPSSVPESAPYAPVAPDPVVAAAAPPVSTVSAPSPTDARLAAMMGGPVGALVSPQSAPAPMAAQMPTESLIGVEEAAEELEAQVAGLALELGRGLGRIADRYNIDIHVAIKPITAMAAAVAKQKPPTVDTAKPTDTEAKSAAEAKPETKKAKPKNDKAEKAAAKKQAAQAASQWIKENLKTKEARIEYIKAQGVPYEGDLDAIRPNHLAMMIRAHMVKAGTGA